MSRRCDEELLLLEPVRTIAVWVERIFWLLLVAIVLDRCAWSCSDHDASRRSLRLESKSDARAPWQADTAENPADPGADRRQRRV